MTASPSRSSRHVGPHRTRRLVLRLLFLGLVAASICPASADEEERQLAEMIFASPNLAPVLPADEQPVVRLIAIVDSSGAMLPIGAPIRVDRRELEPDITQAGRRVRRPELLAIATDTGVTVGAAYWAPVHVKRTLFFDAVPEPDPSGDPDAPPVQFRGGRTTVPSGVAIVTLPFYPSGRVEFFRPSSLLGVRPSAQRALQIDYGRQAPPQVGAP